MYSVSSLVKYLKQEIDFNPNLQNIVIKGEVSNLVYHRSGHVYFTIKDSGAQLSCIMFASYAKRSTLQLKDGMQIILSASLSMYEARGSLQLYVTKVQLDGIGDLYLRFEELKKKLSAEGLFEKSHKKELPKFPERIAVLSARTGAAIQDILTTISRRWPLAEVEVYPTLVQGESASADIIKNLKIADEGDYDVILLARGGGSIEDLWCFNDEELARVIYDMKTVIVSGVGHETDTTLVDYVSDSRAPTPTAAAELITPNKDDIWMQVLDLKRRSTLSIESQLKQANLAYLQVRNHPYIKDPMKYVQDDKMKLVVISNQLSQVETMSTQSRHRLDVVATKLNTLAKAKVSENTRLLDKQSVVVNQAFKDYRDSNLKDYKSLIGLLDAYSPLKILQRGYQVSYVDGHVIKSIDEVEVNQDMKIRMHDGFVSAKVMDKEEIK